MTKRLNMPHFFLHDLQRKLPHVTFVQEGRKVKDLIRPGVVAVLFDSSPNLTLRENRRRIFLERINVSQDHLTHKMTKPCMFELQHSVAGARVIVSGSCQLIALGMTGENSEKEIEKRDKHELNSAGSHGENRFYRGQI